MTRRYLYIEEEKDPKIEGYDFSLADPHPTKPIDVFRHLESERFAGVSECVSTQARYTVLYTRRLSPPPTKGPIRRLPTKKTTFRPRRGLWKFQGATGGQRKNKMLPSHFHRSNNVEFYPPALDVANYGNWCGDLKELRRVLP